MLPASNMSPGEFGMARSGARNSLGPAAVRSREISSMFVLVLVLVCDIAEKAFTPTSGAAATTGKDAVADEGEDEVQRAAGGGRGKHRRRSISPLSEARAVACHSEWVNERQPP
jgi:hypothetical protein